MESEGTFIRDLQSGSEHAFKELVETYQDRVFNTCLGFLKNTEEADDASQEVFIEVYQKISSFKGNARLSTWIYRIAVNKCMTLIRYKKRKKRWAFMTSLWDTPAGPDEPKDFLHPGIALENKERASILMEKIEALPENQRVAFTMHKIEGLSYEEIASIMETTTAAIESLIFRARENLKKALKKYYEQQ